MRTEDSSVLVLFHSPDCESGGIGRRAGLRIQWPKAVRVRVPPFAPSPLKIQDDLEETMLLNYEDLSTVRKSVEVEIPADLIANEAKRVTNEFSRHAKIPGFREGKVPLSIVRTRFAKEIQEEVMNRLLPLSFREAISNKGVEPVGDPQLEHMDAFIDGAPLKYKAAFDVKPQFTLHDYKGIDVDDPKIEVSDNDVDEMIERLREQGSSFRPE